MRQVYTKSKKKLRKQKQSLSEKRQKNINPSSHAALGSHFINIPMDHSFTSQQLNSSGIMRGTKKKQHQWFPMEISCSKMDNKIWAVTT